MAAERRSPQPVTRWALARLWADRAAALGLPADLDAEVALAWGRAGLGDEDVIAAASAAVLLDELEGMARSSIPAWRVVDIDGAPALVADLRAAPLTVDLSPCLAWLRRSATAARRRAVLEDAAARPGTPEALAARWGVSLRTLERLAATDSPESDGSPVPPPGGSIASAARPPASGSPRRSAASAPATTRTR